jgi:catechol 2,3-dioxygenase-like lactoylglutathione lyase family enzyme
MKFRLTRNINFPVPDIQRAAEFYTSLTGLRESKRTDDWIEITDGTQYFYFDSNRSVPGPIFEFAVADLEEARTELESQGCTVLRWDGPGKPNYIRDPFGYVFNLWEERAN